MRHHNVCPGSTLQLASHLVAMPYLWNVEEGEKNVFVYVKLSSGTSAQHFRVLKKKLLLGIIKLGLLLTKFRLLMFFC